MRIRSLSQCRSDVLPERDRAALNRRGQGLSESRKAPPVTERPRATGMRSGRQKRAGLAKGRAQALISLAARLRAPKLDPRILDRLSAEPDCDCGLRNTATQEPSGEPRYRAVSE
jgi:hypothetical protein